MLSEKEIQNIMQELENLLFKKNKRKRIDLTLDWIKKMPSEPGIYAVFEKDKLVYIGESGNIKGRMKDLRDSRHHQLRRNIGKIKFSDIEGYIDANSKVKFPEHIDNEIDNYLNRKCLVSILPLYFGRKEFEEYIFSKYELFKCFNKKGKRK